MRNVAWERLGEPERRACEWVVPDLLLRKEPDMARKMREHAERALEAKGAEPPYTEEWERDVVNRGERHYLWGYVYRLGPIARGEWADPYAQDYAPFRVSVAPTPIGPETMMAAV